MFYLRNLTINYAERQILRGVDLQLADGEIFAMLGASGSGKSSLLRFIAGLDEAVSGDITLQSKILSAGGKHLITPPARKIGMVFQDYSLFPHLTVGKNIAFGLHKLPKAKQLQRVAEWLELIGLPEFAGKYPRQLSGGELQRVALARAMAVAPRLLLLDEPFSNLDQQHRDLLLLEVKNILKRTQTMAILVSHDLGEAQQIADRIGTIQNDKLEES